MNTAYKVIVKLYRVVVLAILGCSMIFLGGIYQDVHKAVNAPLAADDSTLVRFDPANRNDGLDLAYNPSTGELKVVRVK